MYVMVSLGASVGDFESFPNQHSTGASLIPNVANVYDCGSRCSSSSTGSVYNPYGSSSGSSCLAFDWKEPTAGQYPQCWHYGGTLDCHLKPASYICHYRKPNACKIFVVLHSALEPTTCMVHRYYSLID